MTDRDDGDDDSPEEELICRFCQCEGSDDNKLVHPCKCRGSVKWVHEECLRNWLRQSHKIRCELCGYKYVFQRGYGDELAGKPPRLSISDFLRDSFNRARTTLVKFFKIGLFSLSFVFRVYFSVWVNHIFLDGSFSMYLPGSISGLSMGTILDSLDPFSPESPGFPNELHNTKQSFVIEDIYFALVSYMVVGLLLNLPYTMFSAVLPQQYEGYIPLLKEVKAERRDLNQQSSPKQIIRFTVYSILFKGLTSGVLVGFPYILGGTFLDILSFISFGMVPSKKRMLTDPDFGGGIIVRLLILCIGYLLLFALFITSYVMNKHKQRINDSDISIAGNVNAQQSVTIRNLMNVLRYTFLAVVLAVAIPLIDGAMSKMIDPLFCDPFGDYHSTSSLKYIVVEFVSLHSSGIGYFIGVLVYLASCAKNAGARLLDMFGLALSNWSYAICFSVILTLFNILFTLTASISCTLAFGLWNPDFLPLRGGAIVDKTGQFITDTTLLLYYTSFGQVLYFVPLRALFSVSFWPFTRLLFGNTADRRRNKLSLVLRGVLLGALHCVFLIVSIGPSIYALATFYRDFIPEDEDELLGIKRLVFALGAVAFVLVSAFKKAFSLLAGVHNIVELVKTIFRGVLDVFCRILLNIVLTVLVVMLSGFCIYMMISSVYMPSKRQNVLFNDSHLSIGLTYLFTVLNINRFVYTFRGNAQGDIGLFHNAGKVLKKHFFFWARVTLCSIATGAILSNLPVTNDAIMFVVEKRYIVTTVAISAGLVLGKVVSWVKSKYILARDRRYARVVIQNYEE